MTINTKIIKVIYIVSIPCQTSENSIKLIPPNSHNKHIDYEVLIFTITTEI